MSYCLIMERPKIKRHFRVHHHHISLALILIIFLVIALLIMIKPAFLGYRLTKEFKNIGNNDIVY